MKRTYLIRMGYLVELDEERGEDEEYFDEQVFAGIGEDLISEKSGKTLEWTHSSSLLLDPSSSNCGRCENCGQWTTDRERPDSIPELCNGAAVDGKLLCDDCLPKDHRWAF